jgi:hypothetical protein
VVQILRARERLPDLGCEVPELGEELSRKDRTAMPPADHASLNPDGSERWREVQAAWDAIAPVFWGDRIPLAVACSEIQAFLEELSPDTM